MIGRRPVAISPPARAADTSWSLTAWAGFIYLGVAMFMPTTVFYVLEASSMAAGLILACIIILGLIAMGASAAPSGTTVVNAATIACVVMMAILGHAFVATYVYPLDLARTFGSTIGAGLVIFTALVCADAVFCQEEAALRRWTNIFRLLFLLIGLWGIIGFQPPHSRAVQPVFPFTEASHYALAFAPLILDGCIRTTGWKKLALLGMGFAIAFLLRSLSLVVATTLAGLICLPTIRFLASAAIGYLVVQRLDISYFTDRLDLNAQSENLSTLVYIQGWELVEDAFTRSKGWGLGFQQLGFTPIMSPTADRIIRYFGVDFNLQDGGFIGAKLLSEFGLFAVIVLMAFIGILVFCAIWLRMHAAGRRRLHPMTVLPLSFICAYSIEVFVRGGGYFSGTTMLVIASIGFLWRHRSLLLIQDNQASATSG